MNNPNASYQGQPQQQSQQNQGQNPHHHNQVQPQYYAQPQQQVFKLPQILLSLQGVYIKQRVDCCDFITPCNCQANRYLVHPLANGTRGGKDFLTCDEQSGCITRNILPMPCRRLDLDIKNNQGNVCIKLSKTWTFTCLIFMRPKIEVQYVEDGNNQNLGYIIDSFDICNFLQTYKIYDQSDKHLYTIRAFCCQIGLLCNYPCEACETVNFTIKDAEGNKIGDLIKVGTGNCCWNLCSNADNFKVYFSHEMSWEHRALLTSAGLWIDYSMFEHRIVHGKGKLA